jgi:hypothetical protein
MNYLHIFLIFALVSFKSFGQTCSVTANQTTICSGQSTILTITHDLPQSSTFSWSQTTQTSNTITVSPTSTTIYSCTVTDGSNNCTSSVTITVNDLPTVTSITPGSRCDAGTVNLSASASAGVVNWYSSQTGGTSLYTGTIYSPNVNSTTSFYVDATNNNCTSNRTQIIATVNQSPILSSVTSQSICAGDNSSAISFSSNIPGSTVSWSNTNNSIGLLSSGSGNISSFSTINNTSSNATASISATATVNGCTSLPINFVFTIKPKPTLTSISNQSICAGDNSSAISFSSNVAGSTFSWSNTNTLIGLSGNGNGNIAPFVTINNSSINANAAITASATANGCTSNSTTFNITVKPKPTIANQNFSFCSSTNYTSNWTGVIPNNTLYTWTVTNNTQVIGETNNNVSSAFSQTLSNLTLQNQNVVYIITPIADACVGSPFTLNLEVKPSPPANAGQDFAKTCVDNINGSSIGSSSIPGFIYSWSPSTGLSSTTISNPFANPSSNTTYTLTVTDQLSTCSATDQVVAIVNNTPPTANAGADGNITCVTNPNGITIGSNPINGHSFTWSPITGLASSNSSSTVAYPSTSLSYTLTVTNNTNGCTSTDQVNVSVNKATPSANAGVDFIKTCTTNNNGSQIGTAAVSGNTYSWTPTIGLSNSTLANPTANPSVTTTYTLVVTSSANGCSSSDQVTVDVNQQQPLVSAGSDFTKTCVANTFGANIGMSPQPNTSYSWSPSTTLTSGILSNPIANPSSTTTYTLTATSLENGCTANDQVIVTVNQNYPTANAGSDFTKTCVSNTNGNTIGMSAVTGITYSWFPSTGLSSIGASNPIANPSQTTLFTLTSTDVVNGCTSTDQVLITVNNELPIAYAGLDALITCNQNVNGAVIGMQPENGINYTWFPSTGLSSSNQSQVLAHPNQNSNYTLTATNPINGCVQTDVVNIIVDTVAPTVNAGSDVVICEGQLVQLSGASNSSNVSWSPSFMVQDVNELTTTATINGSTTFTLTATGSNGCVATDILTAQIAESPISGLLSSYIVCENETINLTVSPQLTCNWSGLYSGTQNDISFIGTSTGNLNLVTTNNYGCTNSETITITVNPIPYPIISGSQAICQNSYWETYSIPSTSNQINWTVTNGDIMSSSNANDVVIHWGLGATGTLNVTETISETGCSNDYNYTVLLGENVALDTAEVLQLSSSVLYTPNDYSFMNWGYESILTQIPVSIGVYSQYCEFPNFNPSLNYYWVEIGDGNGCITKSYFNDPNFIANTQILEQNLVEIFPNPTEGEINIKTDLERFDFEIINLDGHLVMSGSGDHSFMLPMIEIPSGLYFITIKSKGYQFNQKIIKL